MILYRYCSRSLTDRMLACEAGDPSSILGESTSEKISTAPDFFRLVLDGGMFVSRQTAESGSHKNSAEFYV